MKNIETIKQELINFGEKYKACKEGIEAIDGDSLTELFGNISPYINWCKMIKEKIKEFNSIFSNDLVIEDGVLLCCCSNLESIVIPDSVTKINNNAFRQCTNLESIIIPNSVTSIGESAFHFCRGLTSIEIPNSVTYIGDDAFRYCTRLTSVTIPNSVTTVEDFAFSNCRGLTSVTIPNSVSLIGNNVFYKCNPGLEIIRK